MLAPASSRSVVSPFQSAPAIAGGRCSRKTWTRSAMRCFNPRPPLLAGDACTNPPCCSTSRSFNPRPPLLAGDAAAGTGLADVYRVSIRARHCWRAMPPYLQTWSALVQFQSAPAIAGGRCRQAAPLLAFEVSFNPRPPLLAGDAVEVPLGQQLVAVSIRARHCWRAMHLVAKALPTRHFSLIERELPPPHQRDRQRSHVKKKNHLATIPYEAREPA